MVLSWCDSSYASVLPSHPQSAIIDRDRRRITRAKCRSGQCSSTTGCDPRNLFESNRCWGKGRSSRKAIFLVCIIDWSCSRLASCRPLYVRYGRPDTSLCETRIRTPGHQQERNRNEYSATLGYLHNTGNEGAIPYVEDHSVRRRATIGSPTLE